MHVLKITIKFLALIFAISTFAIVGAKADKLDDVIASGELKCGVMLDVPPVGFRNNDNEPIGYDVEFCKDMAAALGVDPVFVETPGPDRIPAILSGRVDVGIASATASLERAKSVAFSIPYQIWDLGVAVSASDSSINSYEDLKNKKVGTVRSTSGEAAVLDDLKNWGNEVISYNSNAEQFLALKQGKVDAIIESNAIFGEYAKGDGKGIIKVCCSVTTAPSDWTGLMVHRSHQGLLNWVNLFVWHQWKNGRTDELYREWFGYAAPSMAFPGTHGY
ncbi:transporter substrate-binding domain-containing protein [Alphaproteobacteria bacterium]|jgi:ABC-type amino acid transport substrate-binding protein|nr:transporter substrate-binding domain-containing protein [Alphaproteobacteria bacterium]MDB4234655.1 transporter substrate-binding domain-containing protein [Alphaproteobacteria bacterium]MDB9825468.1 transporter substrate-binding domain-containing protein [Alphaproteobacteria bacterium]|tara:strand:- start:17 stop:844 length:828 start_codon:yes stop_codon:yes gene_type:complete